MSLPHWTQRQPAALVDPRLPQAERADRLPDRHGEAASVTWMPAARQGGGLRLAEQPVGGDH
jgi:hypothetical protein